MQKKDIGTEVIRNLKKSIQSEIINICLIIRLSDTFSV